MARGGTQRKIPSGGQAIGGLGGLRRHWLDRGGGTDRIKHKELPAVYFTTRKKRGIDSSVCLAMDTAEGEQLTWQGAISRHEAGNQACLIKVDESSHEMKIVAAPIFAVDKGC